MPNKLFFGFQIVSKKLLKASSFKKGSEKTNKKIKIKALNKRVRETKKVQIIFNQSNPCKRIKLTEGLEKGDHLVQSERKNLIIVPFQANFG